MDLKQILHKIKRIDPNFLALDQALSTAIPSMAQTHLEEISCE